jgi:amino acid adenylation domain-containing protein
MTTIANGIASNGAGLSTAKRALLEKRLHGGFKNAPRSPLIPRRALRGPVPLSFAQQRLWFLHQLDPASPLYNMPMAVLLSGPIDVKALGQAISAIVERHEVLRTRFEAVDGSPVQVVNDDALMEMHVSDQCQLSDDRRDAEVRRLLNEEARKPFDFTSGLLLRATLLRLDEAEHVLLVVMHHIASDGWSWGVFFHELVGLYDDFCAGKSASLPELPIQYADFAAWQRQWLRSEVVEKQLAYWAKQLADAPDFLELPTDRPRPPMQTFRGQWESMDLPGQLAQALHELSRREGATLFMTLLAAFQTLLHRYTRATDLLVGTPVAGRTHKETESLIGFFINTLVLRCDLAGNPTYRELLARVRETTIEAFMHQDLPFEKVVEELRPERSPSHSPLIQVMFVLQNAPSPGQRFGELAMTPIEIETGTAKFDLTLAVEERANGLAVAMEYNSDLFDEATVTRMLGHWRELLEGIVANPDQRISDLPLLTDAERRQLLVEWNNTNTAYPREKPIHQLFEEQVEQTPDAVALVFNGRQLTYGELNTRANQLAHHLQKLGVRVDTLVGICMERSVDMIVGLLAILKAGGAYVSLDPAYPKERLAFMLEDAQCVVILTQQHLESCLPARKTGIVHLGVGESSPLDGLPLTNPVGGVTPENLAYVSFTSGSTGRPKGVCVPHRGVVRLVRETNFARLTADEVFLQLAPIAFDASTLEIWGALLNGARLVVFPPQAPTLAEIGETIQRQQVTTLWLTAGLFNQMIEEQPDSLRTVRQLLAGGDVLSMPHVRQALEQLPHCRLINGYGPTENTTFTCCHPITVASLDRGSVPIGRPIARTQVYVLDQHLQPVPVGVPGELYTGGDGLARGYLNRPELTGEKFIRNPFTDVPDARLYKTGDLVRWLPDGNLEFLGRIDSQVKIRGFRIELGEIEAVLGEHSGVRESVVIARPDPPGEKRLVAYVVAKQSPAPAASELRQFLHDRLPAYMLPSAFVFLDALPLSPNGKVDRNALAAPDATRPELEKKFVPPRNSTELRLAKIWEDVLNIHPIGVADKFFDLGGHSLLAVRLLARIEKVFDKRLPLAAIFQFPTIEELANVIHDKSDATTGTSLVEIQGQGDRPPLFLVHGVGGGMFWGYGNLSRHLGTDQPVYAFKSRGLDGLDEFSTIEEMAAQYTADLRAFQPSGPYLLGGYCFGGNVAYEMARLLQSQGERVGLLALMNCAPTGTSYTRIRLTPAFCLRFLKNTGYWLDYVWQLQPAQQRDLFKWKLRSLVRKISRLIGRWRGSSADMDVEELVDLSNQPDHCRKLWEVHVRALMEHHTKPFDGHVTLFRTRGHQFICSYDPQYGWGELVRGGVTVKIIPGAHESILEEPHVQTMAMQLKTCLMAAQAQALEGTIK